MPERRLLYLSPEFPDPEGNGGEVRLFKLIEGLAQRETTVRVVAPGPADKIARGSALERRGVELRAVTRPASRVREALQATVADPRIGARAFTRSWMAWQADVYRHEMREQVADALAEPWDCVVIEHDWALDWARSVPSRLPVGLVFQNLTDSLLSRQASTQSGISGLRARRDARIARLEIDRRIGRVSQAFACSETDAAEVTSRWAVPCAVVPNGADVEDLAAVPDSGRLPGRLLFTGTMSYPPNAQAAQWLADEIFEKVRARRPDATLAIVGRNPSAAIRALASRPGIEVPGRVPDLRPWLTQAEVVVAPLLAGSGTKLKVIEAMAAGRPVVATPIGAEGIEAEMGRELEVAETAEQFAAAVVELLADSSRARRMGGAGRELAARLYSWDASATAMHGAIEHWLGDPG